MVFSDFTNQEYTPADFLHLLEHRIRKDIRQSTLLDPKGNYAIDNPKSLQARILAHFLQQIFEGRLSIDQSSKHILDSSYLEKYISERLDVFTAKKDVGLLQQHNVAPLRSVTAHELQEAAKLLTLDGELTKQEHKIIADLTSIYKQTKPSFLKSFLHIENLSTNK